MKRTIAICGAGIVGVASAYYLIKKVKSADIILIDKHQPLSFTSSKSGENFRDYWPHPCMEALSSRSIELMKSLKEELGHDAFNMEFSGYHFVSHKTDPIFTDDDTPEFQQKNTVEYDQKIIQIQHPYLDKGISKSVFIKNAGHVDSITMAAAMFTNAKESGLRFQQTEIINLESDGNGINIHCSDQDIIHADQLIIATGPFLNQVGKMIGLSFPIWNTLQRKFIIPDPQGIIPRDMPFTIYADGQYLQWSDEESELFKSNGEMLWMTEKFPGAIHIKPESGDRIKMGWAFSTHKRDARWDIPKASHFPQLVLTGASRFIPELKRYAQDMPTPVIEYGGYYTRTAVNWPLIGPTEKDNIFVIGAFAGFGTMAACAAGELCSLYLSNKSLPTYAKYFHPNRYDDKDLITEMNSSMVDGQL